jgi:mannose-6-phosphate isomerase-like protein (cupin superfamily)
VSSVRSHSLTLALIAVPLACRHAPSPVGGAATPLRSVLSRADEGAAHSERWGEWRRRLRGDTLGSKDLTVALFTLTPGQAPHPPHCHAEEELMVLVEGSGTWTVRERETPAAAGDLVYAAPWELHGVRNTGRTPLRYYVIKWSGRAPPP